MATDGVVVGVIFIGSLGLRFGLVWPTYSLVEYAYSTLFLCLALVGSLYLAGLYGDIAGWWHLAGRTFAALVAGGLVLVATDLLAAALMGERVLIVPTVNLAVVVLIGTPVVAATRQRVSVEDTADNP